MVTSLAGVHIPLNTMNVGAHEKQPCLTICGSMTLKHMSRNCKLSWAEHEIESEGTDKNSK